MKVFGGSETKMVAKNEADESKCHMDDILSLDISVDRKTVVTGQVGNAPSVHVWDSETGESKVSFKLKEGSRGVAAISISPCQRYVACVDLHNEHRVVIYNIKRKKELLQLDVSKDKIINVAWSKKSDDLRFATIGLKEIKFWNPADSSKKLFQKGVFGDKGRITNFTCAVFDTEGNCYSAGANGSIYVWDSSNQLQREVKGVHEGEITAITHESGKLISGGRDGKLVVHTTSPTGELGLEKSI